MNGLVGWWMGALVGGFVGEWVGWWVVRFSITWLGWCVVRWVATWMRWWEKMVVCRCFFSLFFSLLRPYTCVRPGVAHIRKSDELFECVWSLFVDALGMIE